MDEKDGSYPPANTETNQRYSVVSEGPREEVFRTGPVGIIGKHRPREIVRIERDYAAGETVVQYWAGSLPELDGRVTPTQHAQIVNELNGILASASNPYKSILDNVLAILSLYLSTFLYKSHFQNEMQRFQEVLGKANQEVYNPAGLNMLDPSLVAYLFLEIEYY